jgi:MerR family transcriptional regulator, mercuric resistance operon regulatory protein
MEGLTRGQLAQRAQINLERVRYYEQEGLLARPSRTASGHRKFAEVAVDRLAFVKGAKALGFSLGDSRASRHPGWTCGRVRGSERSCPEQAGDCPRQENGDREAGS